MKKSVDYLELSETPEWLKREFGFMGCGGAGGGNRVSGVEGKLSQAGLNRINKAAKGGLGVDLKGRISNVNKAIDTIKNSRDYKGKQGDLKALRKLKSASKKRAAARKK